MFQSPRGPARLAAPLAICIAAVLVPWRASASPSITVSPASLGPIELPAHQVLTLTLRIYDRDSLGPTPLMWSISDVLHGTENDALGVTESPVSGTVAPGDSASVGFTIDVSEFPGNQSSVVDLRIDSNDPVHPRVVVPFTFDPVVPDPVRRITLGELKARYR